MINIKESGFTLVELVVVIGMISALSGFFVVNTTSSRNMQKLDIAAKQVVSMIREAQAMGQSGRAFGDGSDGDGSSKFDRGYGVYVTKDPTDGANTKLILFGGAGDGVDSDGDPYANEDLYDVARKVSTTLLPSGVTVTYVCVEKPASGNCEDKDEVGVLARRGLNTIRIDYQGTSDEWRYSLRTEITLAVGTLTKVVYVNKYGVVYVKP